MLVWLVGNLKLEVTEYSKQMYGSEGLPYPSDGGDDDDGDDDNCRHHILSALTSCVGPQKFQKYYRFSMGLWRTSKLMWRNPFKHQSTRGAILGQINQNAPG